MKESLNSNYPNLVFRETFTDEQAVLKNGGVATDVDFENGVAKFRSNGYISYLDNKTFMANGESWSVRVILDNVTIPVTEDDEILSNGSVGSQLRIEHTSGDLELYFDNGIDTAIIGSSQKIFENKKNNIWITCDGSNLYLYNNGTLYGSTSVITNMPLFTVFGGFSGTRLLNADMCLVEFYNTQLSVSEMDNLDNNTWNKDQNFGGDTLIDFDSTQGILEDRTVGDVVGDNLVVNEGFDNWTGDNPVDWTVDETNPVSGVTEVDTGCRMFTTDGTLTRIRQIILTIGKEYRISLNTEVTSGSFQIRQGTTVIGNISSSCSCVYKFTASNTEFKIQSAIAGSDFIINNVSIQEIRPELDATDVTVKKQGAEFNSTTSKIDTGTDMIGTKAVTIMGWIKPTKVNAHFLDNGKTILRINSLNNNLSFSSDGNVTKVYSPSGTFRIDELSYMVVTVDTAGLTSFYKGDSSNAPVLVGVADQDSGTRAAGTSNVFIGSNSISFNYMGLIPKLTLVEGILTIDQITNFWSNSLNSIK